MSEFTDSILVTGGTQGMGYYCSLALAKQLPSTLIIVASRSDPQNSAATINKTLKQSNVKYMQLDLGSLAKVRDFASRWHTESYPPLRALVFNAAIQFPGGVEYTPDGIEKSFGVNHVGHALLFHLLLAGGCLKDDARIVNVASGVHDPDMKWGLVPRYTGPEQVAQPSDADVKKSSGRDRYATSKVANVLWTMTLARHFSSSPKHIKKTVVAMDPGLMPATGLSRNASWVIKFLANTVMPKFVPLLRILVNDNIHLPSESGESLAWLAIGDECKNRTGVYYEGRKERPNSKQTQNESLQEELWKWTVEKVGQNADESKRFDKLE